MNDGQPLIERPQHGASTILRRLADQIDKMDADTFGGVAVIVPPQDGGEPIEIIIIDPKKSPGQFYAMITSRLQTQTIELDEMSRRQQGFGRSR